MQRDWIMLLLQHEGKFPLGQGPKVTIFLSVQKICFEIISYDNFARQFNS